MFQGDIDEIEELMKSREMSYADYIQTSSDKYQSSDNQVDRNSPQPSGGLLGSLGKMFSSGKKWFINIFLQIIIETIYCKFDEYRWNLASVYMEPFIYLHIKQSIVGRGQTCLKMCLHML